MRGPCGLRLSVHSVEGDVSRSRGGEAERSCGPMGQIDDASAVEGPAIVDAHDHGAAVPLVNHPDAGAEGQAAMGGGHGARIEGFPAGGAAAVKARTVPGGMPPLEADSGACRSTRGIHRTGGTHIGRRGVARRYKDERHQTCRTSEDVFQSIVSPCVDNRPS